MSSRRQVFSRCAQGVLWFLFSVLTPPLAQAHTMGDVGKFCPLDQVQFITTMDFSGTSFGMRLDLRPVGPTAAPWRLAVCPKDHFVLFKDEFSADEIAHLKKFVHTPQYQDLAKDASSYFLVGKIFEYLKKDESTLGHIFLKATWQVEGDAAKYRRYAEVSLQHFNTFLAADKPLEKAPVKTKPKGKGDDDEKSDPEQERITAELVAGELERRLEKYDEAKTRFTRIAAQPAFKKGVFAKIVEYQLQLIAQKDNAPHQLPKEKS